MAFMFNKPLAQSQGITAGEIASVFCTHECRRTVAVYRSHNAELIEDYNDIKRRNLTLVKNEKLYKEKIEAQRKDIAKLKKISALEVVIPSMIRKS